MARLPIVYALRVYQLVVSPLLGPCCRFHPSCSHYAVQAVERFGALRGLLLAAWRVARCHPWSAGGPDPVPEAFLGRPAETPLATRPVGNP